MHLKIERELLYQISPQDVCALAYYASLSPCLSNSLKVRDINSEGKQVNLKRLGVFALNLLAS